MFDNFLQSKKMKSSEMIILFQSLSFMIMAGLSISDCLTVLIEDESSKINKSGPKALLESMQDGLTLPNAFKENEDVLGKGYWRQLLAADLSGKLPDCMIRIAEQIKNNKGLAGKVRSALAYPIFVIIISLVAGYIMFTKAVPELASMMAEFDAELPIMTQIMLHFSELLIDYGVFIILFGIIGLVTFIYLSKHQLKYTCDKLKTRLPLFGPIVINVSYSSIYRIISDLIYNGTSEVEALSIAADSVNNDFIKKELKDCYNYLVSEAVDMTTALGVANTMPSEDRLMLRVGQKTGNTINILDDLAIRRRNKAVESVDTMLELLNPIIMAIVCVFVGILVVSVYLPMITMSQSIA